MMFKGGMLLFLGSWALIALAIYTPTVNAEKNIYERMEEDNFDPDNDPDFEEVTSLDQLFFDWGDDDNAHNDKQCSEDGRIGCSDRLVGGGSLIPPCCSGVCCYRKNHRLGICKASKDECEIPI